jgi:hypothetical protein
MSGVSREQIARAKKISIEDYILSHEPHNVKRIGRALYLKDHNSLEISNGLWNWHSRGIGGKNVIDYLIKVRGYGFVDAVRHLAGDVIIHARTVTPKARPPDNRPVTDKATFRLPRHCENNERVIEYLQSRGIDETLIKECIRRNVLYESADFHNAVFVGRGENGKAKFAAMRGIYGDFKQDAEGSDKRFGFFLPPKNPPCNTVFVFESPIDLLSFDTLHKLGNIEAHDGWRLSLGGTTMLALTNLIERQKFKTPISNCVVCTDNDAAGHFAFSEISEKLTIKVSRSIPAGKDWNETLQKIRNEVKPLEDKRKDIRFINSGYDTLFAVKDGDSIKFTSGYNGEVKTLKCRFIDETHTRLIGRSQDDYHICQLAEINERNGNRCEAIPGQKPMLNILAAKYGESLQDIEIPMADAAIKKLVGGKYTPEEIRGGYVLLRGMDGAAVCKSEGGALSTVHPYWAQTLKRELGAIEPSFEKSDFLGKIGKFKDKAAVQPASPARSQTRAKTAEALG